jgi:hypothetical protein
MWQKSFPANAALLRATMAAAIPAMRQASSADGTPVERNPMIFLNATSMEIGLNRTHFRSHFHAADQAVPSAR